MKKFLLTAALSCSMLLFGASCGHANPTPSPQDQASKEVPASKGSLKSSLGLPLVVDFSATWCPPCRQLKPIFHALQETYKGKVDMITIDVDENEALAREFGISAIPAIIYINSEGQEVNRTVGFIPEEELNANIQNLLKSE